MENRMKDALEEAVDRAAEKRRQQKVRMEERKRCAAIARSFVSWPPATKAGVVVAIAIANAIENNANG